MSSEKQNKPEAPLDSTFVLGNADENPKWLDEARRARLVCLSGWEVGRQTDLSMPVCRMGRSPDLEVTIPNRSVSREHAQVCAMPMDGYVQYEIRDMGSSNGVLVNGRKVSRAVIKDGDKVKLGEVLFRFQLQDAEDEAFQQHLYSLIHFDRATGLMTLESFRTRLDSEIARADPETTRFSLAMTDLDGLKRVNDTYGHQAGGMVVSEMGKIMRSLLRPGDRAGLFGGDEAIVLFPDTAVEVAREVAEQVRRAIEHRVFEHQVHSFQVSITQGLAEWPRDGRTASDLISAADSALYAAKAAGRNCIRIAGQ